MPVKVELVSDVYLYLARLSAAEREEFARRLEEVRAQPIARSEPHFDRNISRYALRRFGFGRGAAKIAIFEYDAAKGRTRVLKCRLRRPRESGGAEKSGPAGPGGSP